MSVSMIQKQKQRRSSLVIGIMLGLLLGVAMGFFVLAMPIRMLETVTTFTRLSSLMVQAEPPIYPSDRMTLAVIAGLLTAGIGWVLVDWLLFGRAGMRTLIGKREDEFEEMEVDSFRPADPLDLVAPAHLPDGEWAMPGAGDTRRPISARTDIGNPPGPEIATRSDRGAPDVPAMPPPIEQILPTAAPSSPTPVPEPAYAFASGAAASFQQDRPPLAPISPDVSWPPAPGVRADGSPPAAPFYPLPEQPAQSPPFASGSSDPQFGQRPFLSESEPPASFVAPEPAAAPARPAPSSASPLPPPVASTAVAGLDKARLEDLLERLERGLQKRRAAQARAAAQGVGWVTAADIAFTAPEPAPYQPPTSYSVEQDERPQAPPPQSREMSPWPMVERAAPPPGFVAPPVMPTTVPVPDLPYMRAEAAQGGPASSPGALATQDGGTVQQANDDPDRLLDQPLHVTLELLRSKLKGS